MNYIAQNVNLALFQFGPVEFTGTEISLRQVAGHIGRENFYWMLEEGSNLKQHLRDADLFCHFEAIEDVDNADLIGYNPDDKLIVATLTPDCHLIFGQTGFRLFYVTFKKKSFNGEMLVDGKMIPIATE